MWTAVNAPMSIAERLAQVSFEHLAGSTPQRHASRSVYSPPTKAYGQLLLAAAARPPRLDSTDASPSHPPASLACYAGWLAAETVDCPPVLVAHSLPAVVALLHETLPAQTLSDASWHHLLTATGVPGAAPPAATATVSPPRSAQKHGLTASQTNDSDSDGQPCRQRRRRSYSAGQALHSPSSGANEDETETEILRLPPNLTRHAAIGGGDNDDDSDAHADAPGNEEAEQQEEEGEGEEDTSADAATAQQPVTTVSNHNRRAEKARELRREKAATRRREGIGLIPPAAHAPATELKAYSSIAAPDEPQIAWIIKRPIGEADFFSTARLPYKTATTMLERAYSVGDDTARTHAAHFVQNWRRTGSPLIVGPAAAATLQDPPSSSLAPSTQMLASMAPRQTSPTSFGFAWDAVTFSESMTATAGIVYRWGMACIGRQYQREIDAIQAEDDRDRRRNGHGGKVRTRAKRRLWDEQRQHLRITFGAFNSRVKRSLRWFDAAKALGWGSLVLIPAATVTANWAEQTLRASEWAIWLQLVARVNPDAVQASRAFEAWLGPVGLEGGPIATGERLAIEASLSNTQAVRDSESDGVSDSEDSDSNSSDNDKNEQRYQGIDKDIVAPTRPKLLATSPTPRPRAATRQLTLPELFQPKQT